MPKAENILKKQLEINKNDAYLQSNYGEFYFLSGQNDKALETFQKSLSMDPKNSQAYLRIAQIYYGKGEIDDALRFLKTGVNISPGNKELVKLSATLAFEKGNYYESIKYYKNYLSNSGYDSEILSNLAFIYEKLGFINFAIWAYKRAMEKNSNVKDMYNLALLYHKINKFNDSIICMKSVMQENPNSIEYYIFLTKTLLQRKEMDYANAVIGMAQKIDPENEELLMLQGNLALDNNKYKEALAFFKKAITKSPKNVEGYTNIAHLFLKLNQPQNAEFMLKQGLKFIGEDSSLNFLLGDTVGKFPDRFEEAIDYYNKAKALDPSLAFTHLKLAKDYISIGELDKAFTEIKKHLEEHENDEVGYELLGYIYIQNGLLQDALSVYEKILKLKNKEDRNIINVIEVLKEEIESRESQ